jgi:Acyclic terpene utilisation family protein AtuA
MKTIRIGAGAGYSGDRIEPAVDLAKRGGISYLVFECLAERTIALAQLNKKNSHSPGYDPLLCERMKAVLRICHEKKIRIISNMGAANPVAAAAQTVAIARQLGLCGVRVACVVGDDVLDTVRRGAFAFDENGNTLSVVSDNMISANAYLGAEPIVEALNHGADVILTGRIADPSLFLGPLVYEFGWSMNDWRTLGQGTLVGHLLECAGQITGGYFADPGYKEVPNLANLGFPYAEVGEDGRAIIAKIEGSGGIITKATCKEQILYEIQDPAAYLTPDVIANFSNVSIEVLGRNRICVSGGNGRCRPDTLKVSVGYRNGYLGEAQISYAGPGALARAKLAKDILSERLSHHTLSGLRFDFIGLNSIHGKNISPVNSEPYEVRLRAIARAEDSSGAELVPREVEALYTNGPAGGGGVVMSTRENLAIHSLLIPRDLVNHQIHFEVS